MPDSTTILSEMVINDSIDSASRSSHDHPNALHPNLATRMPPPQPQSPQRSLASVHSISSSPMSLNTPGLNTPQDTSRCLSPGGTPQGEATGRKIPQFPAIEDESGMVRGLELLESQQEEAERRRQLAEINNINQSDFADPSIVSMSSTSNHSPQSLAEQYEDDDENTASTVTGNTADYPKSISVINGDINAKGYSKDEQTSTTNLSSNKFSRFLLSSKKRLTTRDKFSGQKDENPVEDDEEAEVEVALIYGHLQKLGRNGKWQTRWFETDGECLSYYKTKQRSKLLATLDLTKVGCIVINDEDPEECTFTIQVLGRPYHLRAESKNSCEDWVIQLNRVKEARLEQGNVKLIAPTLKQPPDLLNGNVCKYTPVVAVANRQRTRAVDDINMETWEVVLRENQIAEENTIDYPTDASTASISQVVLAQWQKRRTNVSRLASKLARWARSLKNLKCTNIDNIVSLDQHVHPPGHDDKHSTKPTTKIESSSQNMQGLNNWIGNDAKNSAKSGTSLSSEDAQPIDSDSINNLNSGSSCHEEKETRELS